MKGPLEAITGLLLVLMLGSCRGIADLRDLAYEPPRACGRTTLPEDMTHGRVRLVNAGTKGAASDFCLRATGTTDWGTSVFATGGPSCAFGLGYAEATVPFGAPAAEFDVKSIPAGSTCDAPATSELDRVHAAAGKGPTGNVMTLLRYGGGRERETIAALPEDPPDNPAAFTRFRLVNALASGESINFGYAIASTLPTTIAMDEYPKPIRPGGVEPATTPIPALGPVDQDGYLQGNSSNSWNYGIVLEGSLQASFVVTTTLNGSTSSVYAIGSSSDATHPLRGLICPEDVGGTAGGSDLLARCSLSLPPSLVVDTFNAALYGANAPFNDQRRPWVSKTIAERTSDLMCVIEADWDSDKEAIAAAASGHFPYAYYVSTDLDTKPTDPTDARPPPSSAPCAGIDPETLSNIFQCTAQKCATPPDMTGHIETTNCLQPSCLFQYGTLYRAGFQQDACFDCLIYYTSGESSLEHVQQECTTDVRAPFAYDGANGTLMLSHYPLTAQQALILPGTGYRRVALYAQAVVGAQHIDFYCAQLISPIIDSELPYTGSYGMDSTSPDGGVGENGWEDEQYLQAGKVVDWIRKTSGATGNPVVIAGDWHATDDVTDAGGNLIIGSQSPEVLKLLDRKQGGAFDRAEPSGFQPRCTYCPAPENVLNTSLIQPEDFTPTFLMSFPPSSVTDDVLWGTQNVVPLTSILYLPAPSGGMGPPSTYYGRSVHLIRPTTP